MAFVASETQGTLRTALNKDSTERYLNLFVPTTPNPTSGFFFMVPEREVRPLAISIDQAFKTIVSGGVLSPDEHEGGGDAGGGDHAPQKSESS